MIAAAVLIALLLGAIAGAFFFFAPRQGQPLPVPTPTPTSTPTSTPTPTPTPTFPMDQNSIDDPASAWVVVNKLRPLNPQEYAPGDLVVVDIIGGGQLRASAAQDLQEMIAAYTAETGNQLQSLSTYRSYSRQVDVYNGWVASLGQEAADLTSARPGHSEHQTGFVMDFGAVPNTCALDQCFADTSQGMWLAENAYKWGFILRYPEGKTPITGYEFEPWHYRWVGTGLATEMHNTGVDTLEEFFGLPAAPDYAD